MTKLNHEQRNAVLSLWREGVKPSSIAKKLGLLREYVQAYVHYLNKHSDTHCARPEVAIPQIEGKIEIDAETGRPLCTDTSSTL